MQIDAKALFDKILKPQSAEKTPEPQKPEQAKADWMYCKLPERIRTPLKAWARDIVRAIDGATPVLDLHITLFHALRNVPRNRKRIETVAGRTLPCEAVLSQVQVFRSEQAEAVVISLISPQLRNFREDLQSEIEHTPSIHTFSPHITVAYVPHGEGAAFDGLVVPGIDGTAFTIEDVFYTLHGSPRRTALIGRTPGQMHFRKTETKPQERETPAVATKGMSTLSGESGGFLVGNGRKKKRSNEWIDRIVKLAAKLEEEFDHVEHDGN